MARKDNPFALLDEEDSEDVMAVVARVEAKISHRKQQQQKEEEQQQKKVLARPIEPVEGERAGGGRRGRRSGGREGLKEEEGGGEWNGWEERKRAVKYESRSDGGVYRERRGYGGGGGNRGFIGEEGWEGRTVKYDNGRDSERRGYGGGGNRGFRGDEGWEKRTVKFENGRDGEGSSRYRERRGYGGGDGRGFRGGEGRRYGNGDGRRYMRVENEAVGEKKEEVGDDKKEELGGEIQQQTEKEITGDSGTGWDDVTEMLKESEEKQIDPEKAVSEVPEKKPVEEEAKNMTLEEYEKILFEKRKALKVPKVFERKVDEKEFEGMQVVGKKKEDDLFIKLNSETEKLKKKDSLDKEEKTRKSVNVSINEFLKTATGEKYYGPPFSHGRGHGRGRGRENHSGNRTEFTEQSAGGGTPRREHVDNRASFARESADREFPRWERGGYRGGYSRRQTDGEHYSQNPRGAGRQAAPIHLEDPGEFPVLGYCSSVLIGVGSSWFTK